ncbi:acetyl-CoA carboxylase biotin carboxyl carrier protein [Breznakia sp. PF5-3]|uniref:acetyl-CoA carboxylase biotin carboxyl carrier protein n=1 Tax=unclassified Breznakia TaxID=2623764 RepID=UPI002404B84B|nr:MULTISPECIES: biotin/lipoyl-containing protein [unclassified Breznakia]MDF9824705.1 acetyl-CoA carboxylase biotin carboxyl carrier protein [Breznakia sp. PM6-1]MDF9835368.1 acetyl-CoA carboxylase biotin carboxyl carrier protein [Breznakia sp. PF5-3]MDF9836967.1 acetyl-CoA carboxylase biotin carboxyl carrier protein [Breznakia sp. PFB2-8]MDF9859603.1 acetyl-CoA carboxylase biotin carboxyl carrier protein [Breznakia sp. PH5-24]
MDTKKVKQIMELFEDSTLMEMDLEVEDLKIRMKKASASQHVVPYVESMPIQMEQAQKDSSHLGEAIKSPLVGTFYAAASEGAKPFVEVGTQVAKGDTLCIIEAMKVMNEIKAERDGTITSIVVKNNDMVQFDDVLMYIE